MNSFAWAAGFFDGEGCITLTDRQTLTVRVSQKDIRPLHKLVSIFGGKIYRSGDFAHQWTMKGLNAVSALRAMAPHLFLKHQQADVALEWAAQPWRQLGVSSGRRKRKTPEQRKADGMLESLLSGLKKVYE